MTQDEEESMMTIRRTVTIDSEHGDEKEWNVDAGKLVDVSPSYGERFLKDEGSSNMIVSSLDGSVGDDDTTVDTSTKLTSFKPLHCKSQEETVAATTIHDCIQKMRRKSRMLKYQIRGCSAISTILNSMNNEMDLRGLGSRILYDETLVTLVLKAMQRFPESADLQEEACSTLYYLSIFDRASAATLAETLQTIVCAMERHQHTGVQEEACSIICNLTSDMDHHENIKLKKGIRAVLSAMRQHPWNARILETCFAALCNLASSIHLQELLGQEGAIEVILASMSMHPKDCSINEYGCATLSNLSMNCKANQALIAQDNGVVMIVNAMNHDPNHAGIQESACAALANLASSTDETIIGKIRSEGGVDSLLTCMKKQLQHASMQEHCCRAFAYLTQDLENLDPSIDNYNSIRVILAGMRFHVENPQVQGYGCATLRNVCKNSNAREIVASVGGIGTVIVGMRRNCDDEYVQENACSALFRLAENDLDNGVSISSEGGVAALVDAMNRHSASRKVQTEGSRILSYLFLRSNMNYASLISVCVLEALLSAVNRHRDCREIAYLALPVFKELSSKGKHHDAFAKAGGINVVLSVMRCNGHDISIQKYCCLILQDVSLNVKTEKLITRHGGIGTILAAMRIHADIVAIQTGGFGCLCNMSSNPDSQCDLLSEGGLDTILAAMVQHKCTEIQAKGCLLLYSLTDCRVMVPFLLERGAMNIVQNAKTKLNDRYELQNASALLKRLQRW
jgi:hypothetical protein